MELKDIKELMKILKNQEMAELKVRYGKIKLTLTNSEPVKEESKAETKEVIKEVENKVKEEIVKSQNVGIIKLSKIEKGMEVVKGTILGKIRTIGVDTDVKSPAKGILKEILVSDQASVDFAKPLFIIEVL